MSPTDIRIRDVSYRCEDVLYRTPIKFGGVAVDRATLVNVDCVVETAAGRTARGFGSMPLGNVWSFPSRRLSCDDTLEAMKALAGRVRDRTAACTLAGHPIDLTWALEPDYHRAAEDLTRQR